MVGARGNLMALVGTILNCMIGVLTGCMYDDNPFLFLTEPDMRDHIHMGGQNCESPEAPS
jgi:hypothetical protein